MADKPIVTNPVLKTWVGLNDYLRIADELACVNLLTEEIQGRHRKQFLLRIHSRLNKVRSERERQKLEEHAS